MLTTTHDILWRMVKEAFNKNPQGIPIEKILDKISIKPGFVKDNPHLIIMDYVDVLRSAGFLKIDHKSVSKKFFKMIYVPIWRIPENITFTEVCILIKQPAWVLWFMYPEGNLI